MRSHGHRVRMCGKSSHWWSQARPVCLELKKALWILMVPLIESKHCCFHDSTLLCFSGHGSTNAGGCLFHSYFSPSCPTLPPPLALPFPLILCKCICVLCLWLLLGGTPASALRLWRPLCASWSQLGFSLASKPRMDSTSSPFQACWCPTGLMQWSAT